MTSTLIKQGSLQLSPITLDKEYCAKWNISCKDFICLTKNEELINNTVYRIGGMNNFEVNTFHLNEDKYFMLLKHVEAFYDDRITKIAKDKPHLESQWCILDKNGIEKVNFKAHEHPYLVKDSCIYSLDSKYYNIETGELYCQSSTSMKAGEYLFLNNEFDKDERKRGVMKINKKDGAWELFPANKNL